MRLNYAFMSATSSYDTKLWIGVTDINDKTVDET